MKKNYEQICLVTALTAAGLLFYAPSVNAGIQDKSKMSETITAKAVSVRGKDSNIIHDRTATAGGKFVNKNGKTRGKRGELHVDNMTGYYIDLYGNGDFLGTVGPYGDHYTSWSSGTLRFYAKSAGGTSAWGPRTYTMDVDTTVTLDSYASTTRGKGPLHHAVCGGRHGGGIPWCDENYSSQEAAQAAASRHNRIWAGHDASTMAGKCPF